MQMEHPLEEREVDVLADSCALAVVERGAHRRQTVHSRVLVCDEQTDVHWRTVQVGGQMHQPAHRERDRVIADARFKRTVLSETRDRAHDDSWIYAAKILIPQTVSRQHARAVVFRDDIAMTRKVAHDLRTLV